MNYPTNYLTLHEVLVGVELRRQTSRLTQGIDVIAEPLAFSLVTRVW